MLSKQDFTRIVSLLVLLLWGGLGFAQIDSRSGSFKIPSVEDTSKVEPPVPETKPDLTIPSAKRIDELTEDLPAIPNPLDKRNNPAFYMQDRQEFADAGARYTRDMNRRQNYAKGDENQPGHQEDQDLGTYKSGSKFVKIQCRDFSYVDGDQVSILVNDEVVQGLVILKGTFTGFNLELEPGFNKISFKALNQGTSGPNTAEFVIYDDLGNVIVANQWNLLTGVKANLVIVKEE